MIDFHHIPIMFQQCMDGLNVKENGVYLDGTLGGGGHTEGILNLGGTVYGIDQDDDAINYTKERLSGRKLTIIKGNFADATMLLHNVGVDEIDGALLDLGVSSYQLDQKERGFSYRYDAPLDMRMDKNATLSAYDVVNNYAEDKLVQIIFSYGEEKFARQIASRIIKARPVYTTFELVDIIKSAMPSKARWEGKHPAKRTFQAIRIEVNNELGILKDAVTDIVSLLKVGGRMAVITFHSLEDKIVKRAFVDLATGCTCPPDFPICVCGNTPKIKLITRKPIIADLTECEENTRSTCAKLRIIEKL